jgi:asparagine synthetase B (glutamine-hydrolysing)
MSLSLTGHSQRTALDVRIGTATCRIRPAVVLRERTWPHERALYLSLYADEIDERAAALWSSWNSQQPERAWRHLELTDAVVCVRANGHLLVARGAASTFPLYWRAAEGSVRLSTSLPVLAGEPFSRLGLVASAASACLHSSYEPNGFTDTPLARWRRIRRGTAVRFDGVRLVDEHRIVEAAAQAPPPTRQGIASQVRTALLDYRRSQRRVIKSILEVSGGFDSTLSAAVPSRAEMRGVSVAFPYYEFRFESMVQQATADWLGISRVEFDGTDLLPYTPGDAPVRFDEPSVFVTGIRHAEQVARFAAQDGAERIYMGHGGDQCFATNLLSSEGLATSLQRGPFSDDAWRAVTRATAEVLNARWTDRRLGTFIYDARQDVWVKETYGATIRTPFTDRRVFDSALAWSAWCQAQGRRPDKTILVDAARDLLPAAVVTRRGKVAYDGVWMRAYRQQANHIATVFERARDIFTHIGIKPSWLQQRATDLGAWRDVSDREVLALYAVAIWLEAWGLERAADVDWSD